MALTINLFSHLLLRICWEKLHLNVHHLLLCSICSNQDALLTYLDRQLVIMLDPFSLTCPN